MVIISGVPIFRIFTVRLPYIHRLQSVKRINHSEEEFEMTISEPPLLILSGTITRNNQGIKQKDRH